MKTIHRGNNQGQIGKERLPSLYLGVVTHTAPRANRRSTDALVLGFIWMFQTMNPGKMQKVQSDQQLIAE
jgi:hypothetical protein